MRKIVVEFIVPAGDEAAYADVCSELVIEDFLGRPLRVLSDTGWPLPGPADKPPDLTAAVINHFATSGKTWPDVW